MTTNHDGGLIRLGDALALPLTADLAFHISAKGMSSVVALFGQGRVIGGSENQKASWQ